MPARFDRSARTRPEQDPTPNPASTTPRSNGKATPRANGTPTQRGPGSDEHREHRRRQIDASLTRLTAAHAGMARLASIAPAPPDRTTADPDAEGRQTAADQPVKPSADEPDGVDQGARKPARHAHRADRRQQADSDEGTEPPPPSALHRFAKVGAAALAVAVVLVAASGWGTKAWLNASLRPVTALDPDSESIVNPAGQVGDENFLLIGFDPTAGGADPQAGGGAKSDVVMLAHVPADRSRALLVSFPPDLQVTRPPCQRWDPASGRYTDQLAPAEAQTRLGLAYAVGGPRCVTRVMQQITGLSITRFVGLDLVGVRDMVDAVQGVQVCTDRPVVDSVLGPVAPNAGSSRLTGEAALAFARAENVRGDASADYGRIERQQQLVAAMIGKALSNQVLLDPGQLRGFLAAFAAHTVTDGAGADELLTLAQSLHRVDGAEVTVRTVPTTGAPNALGNEVLRESDTKALFGAVRDGKPFPPPPALETAPDAPSDPAPDDAQAAQRDGSIEDTGLQVLNASERRGLADQVRDTLTQLAFTVDGVGDAEPAQGTIIRFTPDNAQAAERLASSVPAAVLTPDAAVPGGLQLVLGEGFDGVIRPPNPAAAPTGGTAPCG